MLQETKEKIIRMRLEGCNQAMIGETVGYSRQTINTYLKSAFPEYEKKEIKISSEDMLPEINSMVQICLQYADGKTVKELAQEYEIEESIVEKVLVSLFKRRRPKEKDPYPEITKYLNMNSKSKTWLAERIGQSHRTMKRTLLGYKEYPLTYEMAEKIQEVTKLSFSQIYSFQLKNTKEQIIESHDPEVEREQRAAYVKPPKKKRRVSFLELA